MEKNGERKLEKWIQIDELEDQFDPVKRSGSGGRKKKKKNKKLESVDELGTLTELDNISSYPTANLTYELAFEKPKRYTYDELVELTSTFKKKIGSGLFGDVYFGKFPNGLEIVVKVLKVNESVEQVFEADMQRMVKTNHRNVVKVFGFCSDGNLKALVYEHLNNGSLDMILYKKPRVVEWSTFYQIAIDVAKGLAYLHHGCSDQIIHHDVKASNVLLDAHFSPKLTDFGLATLMSREESYHTITSDKCSRGYAAPELWSPYSHPTFRCDVYSFGMLLFEVLGRRTNGEGNNWFPKRLWQALVDNKLDHTIVGLGIREKDRRKAKILARVAFWCAQNTPETRPSLGNVATVLEMEILVNTPPDPFSPSNPLESRMQPDMSHDVQPTAHFGKAATFPVSHVSSSRTVATRDFDISLKDLSIMDQQSMQVPTMSSEEIEVLISELDFGEAKRYTFDELAKFTSNFNKRVGFGAYGNIFIGRLPNGVEVAVKVLQMSDVAGETFVAEVRTVAKTDHQNLVELLGFCLEGNIKALVYEYMENGSLDMILYRKPMNMEWEKLYHIAIQTAKALSYLHHDCETQIIHHDVKAGNILLDSSHSPKLTDFGLAKLTDIGATHVTMTRIRGTRGYGAPEVWSPFSHVTCKSDVYSFGMLLFEILGKENNNQTQEWFPKYVWDEFTKGSLSNLMDERGILEKDRKRATILSMVALWCVQFTPEARPSMSTVVTVVEKEIPVNRPHNPFLPSDSLTLMKLEKNTPELISSSNEVHNENQVNAPDITERGVKVTSRDNDVRSLGFKEDEQRSAHLLHKLILVAKGVPGILELSICSCIILFVCYLCGNYFP